MVDKIDTVEVTLTKDDIPGDYDTVEGLKTRIRFLGNERYAEFVERSEERIEQREDGGYSISPPEEYDDEEMLFHIGILTGAALERQYPATPEGDLE